MSYTAEDLRKMGVVEDPDHKGTYVKINSPRGKEIVGEPKPMDIKAKLEEERKSNYFKGLNTQQIMEQYKGGSAGLFIPYDVKSYKNHQKLYVKKLANGKMVPGYTHSDEWKEYVRVTSNYYESYRKIFHEMVGQRKFPITVKFIFVRASNQEFDYCNIAQGVQDLMVDNNWLPDDSCKYLIPDFSEGFGVDRFNPGVIIKL